MSAKDKPHSKHSTDAYRNNHELIWGKKPGPLKPQADWSKAMDKIIEETKTNGETSSSFRKDKRPAIKRGQSLTKTSVKN